MLDRDQASELVETLRTIGLYSDEIPTKPLEAAEDWLFEYGLAPALLRNGLVSGSSMGRLMRSREYKLYQRDVPKVMEDLAKLLPKKGVRSQAQSTLAVIVGNALISWCKSKHMLPLTARKVLTMVCHSMEAIELSFPSYISANLFHLVLENRSNGKARVDIAPPKQEPAASQFRRNFTRKG